MPQTLAQLVRAKYPGAYDDIDDAKLESQVRAKFPGVYDDIPSSQTAPTGPRQPASAEQFMTPEDIANRDMTAMDVVKGAGKGALRSVAGLVNMAAQSRMIPGVTPESVPEQVVDRATPQYTNDAQRLGGTLETVAETALPVVRGAMAVKAAIPSAARAAGNFRQVMSAAKDLPVDINAPGQVALRIAELAQHGGGTQWGPAPVRQFIQYVTDPKKPAMTYEVARDFASNISKLSVKETTSLPPAMKREIAELRVVLNKAVADTANKAGKGREYAAAMTEYAKAMKIRKALDDIIEGAKQAAPYATAAGAGAWIGNKILGGR